MFLIFFFFWWRGCVKGGKGGGGEGALVYIFYDNPLHQRVQVDPMLL